MPKSRGRQKQTRRPYVPTPPKKKRKPSPRWYGWLVLGVFAAGVAVIVLNYMGLMPGAQQLWLWVGLALIAAGFGLATQLR
jgi:fatty acid desaturase